MFEVRCQGCQSPFEVDERRVPRSGMQMRCPKCNTSFLVKRPATTGLPALPSPSSAPPPVPNSTVQRGTLSFSSDREGAPAPPPVPKQPAAPPPVPKLASPGGGETLSFADFDDPGPALPTPRDAAAGLPKPAPPAGAALPARKPADAAALPARKPAEDPGLPAPFAGPDAMLPLPKDPFAALPMPKDLGADLPAVRDFDTDLPASVNDTDLPAAIATDLPSPIATDLPAPMDFGELPMVRDFADPPDPDALSRPLPTGAGYPGAAKDAAPRSPVTLGDRPAPVGVKAITPMGLTPDAPPSSKLDVAFEDEADLPLAVDDLPIAVDFPTSVENLPASVDLPMSADALPAPAADLPAFGPALPAVEPDPLPPVVTSTGVAGTKLGRIGLERKAFTVSNTDDLPALSPGAALPAAAGRARRREDIDPEGVVRRRASSSTARAALASSPPPAAPPPADVMTEPEIPLAPESPLPPPVAPAPRAGFGEIDLGPMDRPGSPSLFGGNLSEAPPAMGVASLPPLENPFDASLQSQPPPTSMQPAPLVDDLLGALDAPADPLARGAGGATSEFEPSKPTEADKAPGRFGKKTVTIELPSTSRFKAVWVLYGALGLLGVTILGGAALALTPYGPFGKNWIDQQLHGEERLAAATRVIREVEGSLDQDTYERAIGGLRRLDQALARVPQVEELQAYVVYANNLVTARFGHDPSRIGRARQVLAQLGEAPPGTRYLNLARASDALARNNAREALRLAKLDPAGRDLATLAAERLGDQEQWLRLAQQGRQRHPSARSRYLLARAAWARGDHETARRESEDVLRVEPRHAGARVLLARLLSRVESERDRALELLRDLVRDGNAAAPARPAPGARPASPGAANPSGASVNERAEACVVAGQVELLRDHVTVAQSRFQRALELDPRSASALVGIGQILYRQGNYSDAQSRFRNAYSADRNNLDAVIGIAQSSLALGQVSEAKEVIEPAVREHPTDGRLQYWLGKALAATSDQRTLAQSAFREAIRLQPENLDAYVSLSEMLFQMQRPEAADQVLLEARARVPDSAAIHRALAHGRLARGDLAGAEAELRIALQREPDDIRSHFALGDVLRRRERLDDAQREFEAVARADANYPGLAMARGQLAEARGELPQALQTFREALARDPTNVELIIRVASTLVSLGNYPDADQMLRSVVVDQPTNADAQYIMGRARLGAGNFVDAVHHLDRAIELNPQRADYKAYAAEAHRQAGDIQRALQLAEQSIELDPTFPRGYWVRAEIRLHRGEASDALSDINRATQLDPHFWSAYATWADIDDALGHRDEAVRLYRVAISHDDRHGEWHYNLGRLLSDSGDVGGARAAFQAARRLNPPPPAPAWYAQATRALADIEREHRNRSEAQRLYTEYLRMVPQGSPAYNSAAVALSDMLNN